MGKWLVRLQLGRRLGTPAIGPRPVHAIGACDIGHIIAWRSRIGRKLSVISPNEVEICLSRDSYKLRRSATPLRLWLALLDAAVPSTRAILRMRDPAEKTKRH